MSAPTKKQLAGAVAELHQIAQDLARTYGNDRPGATYGEQGHSRADAMAALSKRADKVAEILWRLPIDYPEMLP